MERAAAFADPAVKVRIRSDRKKIPAAAPMALRPSVRTRPGLAASCEREPGQIGIPEVELERRNVPLAAVVAQEGDPAAQTLTPASGVNRLSTTLPETS
jgi:hypothetical protein